MELRERVGGPVRCPYCHDDVEPTTARVCAACAAPHHRACWLVLGACSACVVGTARRSDPRTAPAPVLTDPMERRAATRAALERARRAALRSALRWAAASALTFGVVLGPPVTVDRLSDALAILWCSLSFPCATAGLYACGEVLTRLAAVREAAERLRLFDEVDAAEAAMRWRSRKGGDLQ